MELDGASLAVLGMSEGIKNQNIRNFLEERRQAREEDPEGSGRKC